MTPYTGKRFSRDMLPAGLARELAGHHNLLLLIAGLAYVQDNASSTTADRHRCRVKRAMDYLRLHGSSELLVDCDHATAQAVAHCRDRASYGFDSDRAGH